MDAVSPRAELTKVAQPNYEGIKAAKEARLAAERAKTAKAQEAKKVGDQIAAAAGVVVGTDGKGHATNPAEGIVGLTGENPPADEARDKLAADVVPVSDAAPAASDAPTLNIPVSEGSNPASEPAAERRPNDQPTLDALRQASASLPRGHGLEGAAGTPPLVSESPQSVVDVKADAFKAQAADIIQKDPHAVELANYYQERAASQRNVTSLESQLSQLPTNSPERPRVQAQLDLAKAQNAVMDSHAQELENISKNIDAMTKKGHHEARVLIEQEKLGRLHEEMNAEALIKLNDTDLAQLASLAKDPNNNSPWAQKLRGLGVTDVDFQDPKAVEKAKQAIRADLDLQQSIREAYKKNDRKLNKKAKEIDDAIRNGQRPYAEGIQGDLELLKKEIDIQAKGNLVDQHPESAALLGITATGVEESKRDNKEKAKKHKEEKKEQHINKPSLRNAWNQLTEAWKIAWNPKKSGKDREDAWREIARLGFYIGRKVGVKALLFILLTNLAVAVLTPIIALKKINDTFGGGH